MARKRKSKAPRSNRRRRPQSGITNKATQEHAWISALHKRWAGDSELKKSA